MAEVTAPPGLIITALGFDSPAQRNQSPWTGTTRKTGLAGAETWQGSVQIPEIATEEAERPWRAFYFGLRGVMNWFKLRLPCQRHIGPKPRVAAGSTGGYSLPLSGMTPSTHILFAGQYMTVPMPSGRARNVMLTQDLVTNASGHATAVFLPALGQIPTTSAEVETAEPFIPVCSTSTSNVLNWAQGVSGASFDVTEDRLP